MKLENIETERLLLRSYCDDDRDYCLSLWSDKENGKYLSDPISENIDERYLGYFENMADDPEGYYLVCEFKETHVVCGTFCMFSSEDGYDIGYCVDKAYWQQGIGSEMMQATLTWMKGHGAASVTCEVADDNIASMALLEKFGFVPIQKTKFRKWGEDTWFDSHIMKLDLDALERR